MTQIALNMIKGVFGMKATLELQTALEKSNRRRADLLPLEKGDILWVGTTGEDTAETEGRRSCVMIFEVERVDGL